MLKVIISWIQQHIVASVVIGVVVVGGAVVVPVVIINSQDKEPIQQEQLPEQKLVLKDDLVFEINSELSILSLISSDNIVEVLNKDEVIDTSSLGEKEVSIKFLSNNQEKEELIKINIVDTIAPTIQYEKEVSTIVGTKVDLLKNVKVSDNSKEDINATVEGEYNFSKVGTYTLKYVAIDSSNNKAEEEFTLKVNKKQTTSQKPITNKEDNSNQGDSQGTTEAPKEETTKPVADPLAKYCNNNIAGYRRNDEGVCIDISPDDECKYQACFGGGEPYREFFESDEEYESAFNAWVENNYIKSKNICAGKGLGWRQVEWSPYFGACTW